MKPIVYSEIDNPASLLKKLNEIVQQMNYIQDEVNKCATHKYVDDKVLGLSLNVKNTGDLISELQIAAKVGQLDSRISAIVELLTPAVIKVLKSERIIQGPTTSETDRAQAPAEDNKNPNTK